MSEKKVVLFLAAILGLPMLLAAGPLRAEDDKEKAKKHFKQGAILYDEGNYEAALVEFKASYEANPNWKMRYYVAVTLQALHRFVEAEKELELYLEEGADAVTGKKKKEVDDILASLSGVIGQLQVLTEPQGAFLYIGNDHVGETPLAGPLRLDVGTYGLTVKKEGFESKTVEVEVPGGETVEVTVKLVEQAPAADDTQPGDVLIEAETAPKKPEKKIPAVAFYAVAGLTGALLIGTAVTGGLAMKTFRDFEDTPDEDLDARADLRDKGRKLNIAADTLLGLTAASAAALVVMGFFTDFQKKEKRGTAITLSPGPAGASLAITTTF
jgi:tetratricopeptide (TPR) repeat protein